MYNDHSVKPFYVMLLKRSASVKCYDGQSKCIHFLIKDYDLLEKYKTIWDKVNADMKKELYMKPVYNKNS